MQKGIEAFILLINLLHLNESKAIMVCLDSFKLQAMIAFNQKLLRGAIRKAQSAKRRAQSE